MNKSPSDDDRELIDFLKQNKPFIPQEKIDCEKKLIDLVHREHPSEVKQIEPFIWLFPGLVLFGVLVAINNEQPYNHKFAFSEFKPNSSITNSDRELETFVVNSWENVIYSNYTEERVMQRNSNLSLSGAK